MGVEILPNLKEKQLPKLDSWFQQLNTISVDYPDETSDLLDQIIERHAGQELDENNFFSDHSILQKLTRPSKVKLA
jgi:hypothetical protein